MAGRLETEIIHNSDGSIGVYGNGVEFMRFDGATKRLIPQGTVAAAATDGAIFKAGSSTTPASTPIATQAANMSMFRVITGLDHTGSYGGYFRSYVRTAGISADAFRAYGTVHNVAAATVRGAHISLNFSDTGTVTGLGCALEATLHIPNQATQAGTLYAVKAAINSDGSTSDPAGATNLAYFAAVNQGDATGGADVDDDAVLFHIDGHTIADDNMVDEKATEYALAEISHGIKIRVGSTTMWLLASTTNPKST